MNMNALAANVPAMSSAATGTAPPTPGQTANSAESTFLQLLVTELQSQDPTAPMDATQMVGQMLSMNQLNELISINQTLSTAYPTPGTTGSTGSTTGDSSTSSITGAH
jgi:flagellar basal-body rod modification protein FlgD